MRGHVPIILLLLIIAYGLFSVYVLPHNFLYKPIGVFGYEIYLRGVVPDAELSFFHGLSNGFILVGNTLRTVISDTWDMLKSWMPQDKIVMWVVWFFIGIPVALMINTLLGLVAALIVASKLFFVTAPLLYYVGFLLGIIVSWLVLRTISIRENKVIGSGT